MPRIEVEESKAPSKQQVGQVVKDVLENQCHVEMT